MGGRTVVRSSGYQAWLDLRRAQRELASGRLGAALALARRARLLRPDDNTAQALVNTVRERVENLLPAVDVRQWASAAQGVEGWLTISEATLLARCVAAAPIDLGGTVVEIGSYKGRSTLLLSLAITGLGLPLRLVAIDPHLGYHVRGGADTQASLVETLRSHGVESVVDIVRAHSVDVRLDQEIALAFVDGLHDAASVRADHNHIAPRIVHTGLVAFHDYRDSFPGVVQAVDELLVGPDYDLVGLADSLIVLRRR